MFPDTLPAAPNEPILAAPVAEAANRYIPERSQARARNEPVGKLRGPISSSDGPRTKPTHAARQSESGLRAEKAAGGSPKQSHLQT